MKINFVFLRFKKLDWYLLIPVFLLIGLSFLLLYSLTLNQENPDFTPLIRQGIALGVGLIIFFLLINLDYQHLRSFASYIYLIFVFLLILVLFLGKTLRGTQGWFILGPLSFQPVELAKIAYIIFLSQYLINKEEKFLKWKEIITSGFFTLIIIFLVTLQPDLGSALLFGLIWFFLLILGGLRLRQLLTLLIVLLIGGLFIWSLILAPYQKQRIIVFFNPSLDPLGQGYNARQAIIAVGSGKFWGRGLGLGPQSQLQFLPAAHTDFIFAVLAEELGFLGSFLVLIIFGIILIRLLILARKFREPFAQFFTMASCGLLFIHIFVNIGMNLGLLPITGIPLPFLSAGGSALIANLSLLGVLQSMILRAPIS